MFDIKNISLLNYSFLSNRKKIEEPFRLRCYLLFSFWIENQEFRMTLKAHHDNKCYPTYEMLSIFDLKAYNRKNFSSVDPIKIGIDLSYYEMYRLANQVYDSRRIRFSLRRPPQHYVCSKCGSVHERKEILFESGRCAYCKTRD